jgi:hypothetical protein
MRLPITLLVALASVRAAAADPAVSHVLTAPTAWLPPEGAAVGTAGTDHHGDGTVIVGYGFGGLAGLELGTDTDIRGCTVCGGEKRPSAIWLGRAAFRMGARQDAWFRGMPALVIGVRTTFTARGHDFGRARVADAYVVASRVLGPLEVHVGADAVDAGYDNVKMGVRVKPLAGLEWTPPQYPKSTLLADIMWVPRFEIDAPKLEWVAGFGARYQALAWGSIELAVRARQDDGLGGITALVRVNGVWSR